MEGMGGESNGGRERGGGLMTHTGLPREMRRVIAIAVARLMTP